MFFAIVAVIHDQNLFQPIVDAVLALPREVQAPTFFVANGLLSAISDNVFVATVYINEIARALDGGMIDREQFDALAVAINTGTNIPSVATPNGQAAFLFLLTSALGAADPAVVHADGRDGIALHSDDDVDRSVRGDVPRLAPS